MKEKEAVQNAALAFGCARGARAPLWLVYTRARVCAHTEEKGSLKEACRLMPALFIEHNAVFCLISCLGNAGCHVIVDVMTKNEARLRFEDWRCKEYGLQSVSTQVEVPALPWLGWDHTVPGLAP